MTMKQFLRNLERGRQQWKSYQALRAVPLAQLHKMDPPTGPQPEWERWYFGASAQMAPEPT